MNADGSLGERNDAHCIGLEEKLGIHGSPTCVMAYGEKGGAIGTLIGEENRGLACMFTMMNNARLLVGTQGVAIARRPISMRSPTRRTASRAVPSAPISRRAKWRRSSSIPISAACFSP